MFTPCKTLCVIPQGFDAGGDEPAELKPEGDAPDCCEGISAALDIESPEERMAWPSFRTSVDEEQGPGGRADRTRPPELSRQQIDSALGELAERKARREKLSAERLFVIVDGVERASFDPSATARVRLDVDECAEVVEVRARDEMGDVRIGIHMLNQYEQGEATRRFRTELEGGQKLCLGVTIRRDPSGEVQGSILDFDYQQKAPAEPAKPGFHVANDANRTRR